MDFNERKNVRSVKDIRMQLFHLTVKETYASEDISGNKMTT